MSDFLKRLAAQKTQTLAMGTATARPNRPTVSPLAAALAATRAAREAAAIPPADPTPESPSVGSPDAAVAHAPAEGVESTEDADSTPSFQLDFNRLNAAMQARRIEQGMKSANIRNLWFHPESDSLFETIGPFLDEDVANCDNVTDLVDFEERFAEQQTLDAIERERADQDYERDVLEGEIIPPSRELVEVGWDEEIDPSLSTQVDNDHARRAVLRAMAIYNIMEGVNITPDPSQVHAVHTLAHQQYGCLIGAAGTGKTTTTRMLLHVLLNGDLAAGIEPLRISEVDMTQYHKQDDLDQDSEEAREAREEAMERAAHSRVPSIALCAFTGQATQVLRKNMPGPWKANCMTIHSMLAFKPASYEKPDGSEGWRFEPTYTKYLKMPWDVIVVDEASMVNLDLWHMVLDAAKPGCRFYFIGDLNQLPPPIGLGILGFALAKWPVCELTVVHRQSDEAANKIIDTAHAILNGKYDEVVKFDDTKNLNWRVIGYEIDHQVHKAHDQVIAIANGLSKKRLDASVDPDQNFVYDPFRDRIMVPMNGFNTEDAGHLLGQYPLNEALSRLFTDPSVPRIVIDCQRGTKKFAIGYRVMATKNEPPMQVNRITNGLTGKIIDIRSNPKWFGDRRLVGEEADVMRNRRDMIINGTPAAAGPMFSDAAGDESLDDMIEGLKVAQGKDKISGPASHIVVVKFDNGATREYDLNAEIEQLQIAYASTTHKAQGAEMPTAIIVVHHANKFMLSRENLYTAVTRAKSRVVILYTQLGMRIALSKQKISGRNLEMKIKAYQNLMGGEDGTGFKTVKVRLTEADPE